MRKKAALTSGVIITCYIIAIVIVLTSYAQSPPTYPGGIYRALLTQVDEDAPTAFVLKNTSNDEVELRRIGEGQFQVVAAFIRQGHTFYSIPTMDGSSPIVVTQIEDGVLTLTTADNALGQFTGQGTPIEIRVEPEP